MINFISKIGKNFSASKPNLRLVISQIWLPSIISIISALYDWQSSGKAFKLTAFFKVVFPTLFFVMWFVSIYERAKKRNTDNQLQQFKMLAIGRFDVALSARVLVASLIRQAGIKLWYIQEPPLLSQQMYLCLAPRGMVYMAKLTETFRRAVDSGQWARDVGEVLERDFK